MSAQISDLLLSPETFFQDLFAEEVSLRIPALIILVAAAIGAVNAYLVSTVTGAVMAQAMPGFGSLMLLIGSVMAFIGAFIMWAIVAGIFHAISMAFKGAGEFRRTLAAVGWGYIPRAFASVISLAISLTYLPLIRVPTFRATQDPSAIAAAIQQVMTQPAMKEMMVMTTVVGIIFMIWAAWIWIPGVRHARALSRKNAMITVLVPVILYCAYSLYTVISGFLLFGGA